MSSLATPEEPHLRIKTTLCIEAKQRNEKFWYGVLSESNWEGDDELWVSWNLRDFRSSFCNRVLCNIIASHNHRCTV
jgi:hypothetical protein